jgi:hypothetical protein
VHHVRALRPPESQKPSAFARGILAAFGMKSQMAKDSEFAAVFQALKGILQRQADRLSVAEDSPSHYSLEGGSHPKHKKPIPIAWVQTGKAYVSFHHMGVYARPELLDNVSQELRARMQGKSCFNFKAVDHALFSELEDLSLRAFDAFRTTGYMP